jgi:phage antirepressor YoqD-like protein
MTTDIDLFQAKIDEEVEKQVSVLVQKRLKDLLSQPERILDLWKKDSEQKQRQIAELKPLADRYRQFLDSEGYLDAAEASAVIRLDYVDPSGKTAPMGRNYFLKVLVSDGIIMKTAGGYRFTSRYEKRGIGITRAVNRNGRIRSVCLFNAEGVDMLIRKYENDSRVFCSTSDHDIGWE